MAQFCGPLAAALARQLGNPAPPRAKPKCLESLAAACFRGLWPAAALPLCDETETRVFPQSSKRNTV
jgi:hypothetical protein